MHRSSFGVAGGYFTVPARGLEGVRPALRDVTKAIGALRVMLNGQNSVAVVDEPPLMPANARFLTAPVKSGAAR
ncbi:MAG: hypothetical protein ABSG76_25350 [Xanthobacteraceae bacterium]|jgi:hypothetical protein